MIHGIPLKRFARELYQEIQEDDIFNGAAALAYWSMLAIFPAMIFLMAIIPYLPVAQVDVAIMDLLREMLPASTATMFNDVVREVTGEERGGLLSFGFLATLWAMSSGMYAAMQQLNISYDVKESRSTPKVRAVALGLSLLFGALVVGAFSLIVLGGAAQEWLGARYGFSPVLLGFFVVFRWVMILLALLLGFALVYYLAPDVKQKFVFITPGSFIGVALLIAASLGFKLYATNFGDYDATYGSVGAVIVLMLWLYISGLVLLLGSEINALVEHYAPEGKVKGEKVEGQSPEGRRPGNPAAAAAHGRAAAGLRRRREGEARRCRPASASPRTPRLPARPAPACPARSCAPSA